jgi:hypothetical protein
MFMHYRMEIHLKQKALTVTERKTLARLQEQLIKSVLLGDLERLCFSLDWSVTVYRYCMLLAVCCTEVTTSVRECNVNGM